MVTERQARQLWSGYGICEVRIVRAFIRLVIQGQRATRVCLLVRNLAFAHKTAHRRKVYRCHAFPIDFYSPGTRTSFIATSFSFLSPQSMFQASFIREKKKSFSYPIISFNNLLALPLPWQTPQRGPLCERFCLPDPAPYLSWNSLKFLLHCIHFYLYSSFIH